MIFRLLLCCALSVSTSVNAAAYDAHGLRLVLDNGWVVPVSADASTIRDTPIRLDLPKQALGIYRVIEDPTFDRLYVLPQTDYAFRGAVVFEWTSLRRVGFLPGVSDVIVPVDPESKTIVTRRYRTERVDESGWNARIEWLVQGGSESSSVQLRDRSRPLRLLHERELTSEDRDWTLFQCTTEDGKHYRTRVPYLTVNRKLVEVFDPAATELEARRQMMQEGVIADCWRNGDLLKAELLDTGDGISFRRVSADGTVVSRIGDIESWAGSDESSSDLLAGPFAAGLSGEYAFMYRPDGSALIADFSESRSSIVSVQPGGSLRFLRRSGQSANAMAIYFTGVEYRYRSAVSANYIEGGADRLLGDQVYRLSLGDRPEWITMSLPDELLAPRRRALEIEQIRARSDIDEAEQTRIIEALPPMSGLSDALGVVNIVAVLAQ